MIGDLVQTTIPGSLVADDVAARGHPVLVFQGGWSPLRSYRPGDVVGHGGQRYVCVRLRSSHVFPGDDGRYWDVLPTGLMVPVVHAEIATFPGSFAIGPSSTITLGRVVSDAGTETSQIGGDGGLVCRGGGTYHIVGTATVTGSGGTFRSIGFSSSMGGTFGTVSVSTSGGAVLTSTVDRGLAMGQEIYLLVHHDAGSMTLTAASMAWDL